MNTDTITVKGVESARIRVGAISGKYQIEAQVNIASSTVQSIEDGIVREEDREVASFYRYGSENFSVTCTGGSDRATRHEITEAVENFTEAAMEKTYILPAVE